MLTEAQLLDRIEAIEDTLESLAERYNFWSNLQNNYIREYGSLNALVFFCNNG